MSIHILCIVKTNEGDAYALSSLRFNGAKIFIFFILIFGIESSKNFDDSVKSRTFDIESIL